MNKGKNKQKENWDRSQYADVIPSDDVTISSDKKQSLSATVVNEVASELPHKKVTLDEQNASNSELVENIYKTESMSPSKLDYGYRAK